MARARLRGAWGVLLGSLLLATGCSGSKTFTPTPLAGAQLSGRTSVNQSEGCAPDSNPTALVVRSLVRITTPPDASGAFSSGTGIIIDQGWVLTNEHVIDSAGSAQVKMFYADHASAGKVVASDADLDLAIVETDTGDLPAVIWGDEGKLQAGSLLIAVGFAGGSIVPELSAGRYVTTTVDRSTGQAYMVSDVPLAHGDSGGPMLNRCGQVVGINTARIGSIANRTGLSIPGFGARRWATRNRP